MHDIKYIRENPELFDANLNKRGVDASSKEILLIDNERRKLQTLIQEKQKSRNEISKLTPPYIFHHLLCFLFLLHF